MECGNPLYLEWIGEWMEFAREHNYQSYYFYRKAYESMAKYPTKFTHPVEAMCLAGIGEKLVAKLEKKLSEHCKENDLPMPHAPRRKKGRPKVIDNTADENEEEEEPKLKKARSKVQKAYVPTYRSGPYAILLTLLDALDSKTANGDGAMSKHEITTQGQVYCDASLANSEHGKFYTAWNSMKTLLGKNLVYQSSTKYYLTGEGIDLARRMRTIANNEEPDNDLVPEAWKRDENGTAVTALRLQAIDEGKYSSLLNSEDNAMDEIIGHTSFMAARSASNASSSTHIYQARPTGTSHSYMLDKGDGDTLWGTSPERSRSSLASVRKTAISSSASSSTSASSSAGLTTASVSKKEQLINIISDSDEEDDGVSLSHIRTKAKTSASPGSLAVTHSNPPTTTIPIRSSLGLQRAPSQIKMPIRPARTAPAAITSKTVGDSTNNALSSQKGSVVMRSSSSSTQEAVATQTPKSDSFPHLRSNSFSLRKPAVGAPPTNAKSLATFRPIVYQPGTFEVCLVLDIREVRTLTDRDYIGQKLKDRGIKVIKRALDIGDVIWIARLKESSHSVPNELVLDYILERKRMDDLVYSIKDGRFNEQKFRLRRSGLGHVIYLVETHKMGEQYDIGADAIRTAMTSTQVHDGFFLRRTNHTDQTIDYLVSVTNALRHLYENETLYGIPDAVVERASYLDLQAHLQETMPDRTYLTSYRSFGSLNGKSETLMVKDTFVKMLMTIRGISSEKAVEVARVYSTPRAMFSALDDEASKTKRDSIIAKASSNVGRKKIGEALSRKIAEVWYADEYPEV
ncbi:Crossover junction endonuclease mus81 [Mortierella claussenii]|nr:Crossover junction endonuclease mus81 [Mortierella claussenii]